VASTRVSLKKFSCGYKPAGSYLDTGYLEPWHGVGWFFAPTPCQGGLPQSAPWGHPGGIEWRPKQRGSRWLGRHGCFFRGQKYGRWCFCLPHFWPDFPFRALAWGGMVFRPHPMTGRTSTKCPLGGILGGDRVVIGAMGFLLSQPPRMVF